MAVLLSYALCVPSVRRLARLDERHTERSSAWSSIVPRKRLPPW